jgi:TP901 family phage tail tape measure protein
MANDIGLRIQIETLLSQQGGIEALLSQVSQLKTQLESLSGQDQGVEIVTEDDIRNTERLLELLRQVQTQREAGWQRDIASGDTGLRDRALAEQAEHNQRIRDMEQQLQSQRTAIQRQESDQRLANERAAAEEVERVNLESLKDLEDQIELFGRTGSASVNNLSTSFGTLGTMIKSVLASMTAYLSFQGLKNLTTNILKIGTDYDATMQKVRSVTKATDEEFQRLSEIAIKMGAETEFSTSQAAEALQYLAMAGFDVNKSIAALPGTMELATAGTVDLATAADIATGILSGMGMGVNELGHVNDVLVYTMNTSKQGLNELGEAFKYVGPAAKAVGYDLETVAVVLANLANSGIDSGIAGRALRSAFGDVHKVFEKYGESAKDAEGQTRSFFDAIQLLAKGNASTIELQEIFGENYTAISVLIEKVKQDSSSLQKQLDDMYEKAGGSAKNAAEIIRDSLKVIFDEVFGALESISLEAFDSVKEDLKSAAKELTEAIRGAAPELKQYAAALLEILVASVKAGVELAKFAKWFTESGAAAGTLKMAVVLLGVAITKSLIGAIGTMITRARLAAEVQARVNSLIDSGTVTTHKAAQAQRLLDQARNNGVYTNRRYMASTRQVNAALAQTTTQANAAAGAMNRVGAGGVALNLFGGWIGVATIAIAGIAGGIAAWNARMEENRRNLLEQNDVLANNVKTLNSYIDSLKKLKEQEGLGQITSEDASKQRQGIYEEASKIEGMPFWYQSKAVKNQEDFVKATNEFFTDNYEKIHKNNKKINDEFGGLDKNISKSLDLLEQYQKRLDESENIKQSGRGPITIGTRGSLTTFNRNALTKTIESEQETLKKELNNLKVQYQKLILSFSEDVYNQFELGAYTLEEADNVFREGLLKINKNFITPDLMKAIEITGTEFDFVSMASQLVPSIKQGLNIIEENVKDGTKNAIIDINSLLKQGLSTTDQIFAQATQGLSGKPLFDAIKMRTDTEAAFKSINGVVTEMIKPIQERIDALNKALELKVELNLSKEQIAEIEKEIKKSSDNITEIRRNETLAYKDMNVDLHGRLGILREETLKGVQLSEEDKIKAYKAAAVAYIKSVRDPASVEIAAAIETKTKVIESINAKIEGFKKLLEAARAAGKGELEELYLRSIKDLELNSENFQKVRQQLEDEKKQFDAETDKMVNQIQSASTGGGGKGGGGGASKAQEDDSAELAKVAAERAVWEAEQASKKIVETFKRGDVSVSDFLNQTIAARKQMYDAEVAAAQAAVSKAEGAADKAKAQLELDKVLAKGADSTKDAYQEVFDAILEAYNELVEKIQAQRLALEIKVETGEISNSEFLKQYGQIFKDAEPDLKNLQEAMDEIQASAQAAGLNMDFTEEIARSQEAMIRLRDPLDQIAKEINDMIGGAVKGFLSDIASGTVTLGDALRSFLSNIAQGLAEIAAQQIVNSLMSSLGGGGGGIGGFISGLFGGFAEGGKVSGPGTSTSDSILARLSNGEYVIKAKAVKFWGAPFLDTINRMRNFNPNAALPHYAAGGPVGYINNLQKEVDTHISRSDSLSKYIETRQENVQVDVNVKAEADKDKLIKMVVDSPNFTKGVLKANKREAKSLASIIGG